MSTLMKPTPAVPQFVMRLVGSPAMAARANGDGSSPATTGRCCAHIRFRLEPWCSSIDWDQPSGWSSLPK